MAEAASGLSPAGNRDSNWTAFVDRWIYVGMAAFLVVLTLVGFVPDSLKQIANIEAGKRPDFMPIVHVHAVLMGSWLMLLLAQTSLMATGNARYHKSLGIASFVLAPMIVVAGFILAPASYTQFAEAAATAPPEIAAELQKSLTRKLDVLLLQLRGGLIFAALVYLGIRARRTDSEFHKRMMVLATLVPIPASFNRISWLPTTLPDTTLSTDIYTLVCISPMFLWHWFRLGRVHRAYWVFLSLWVPVVAVSWLLRGTVGWHSFAAGVLDFS